MRRQILVSAAITGSVVLTFATHAAADSVSEFYTGKTISIVVGYGTGGGFDATARLVARYLGDHIPGRPNVVVENMPGGGGMRAANHLYNAASKDGTVLGVFSSDAALEPLLGNKNATFSADRFSWIGSITTDVNSCAVWKGAGQGVRTLDDLIKSKKTVVFGSSGPQSNTSKYPLFLKNALNAPIKVVTGYKGTQDIVLAMKRGEVDATCGLQESSVRTAFRNDVASGDLTVFVQLSLQQKSKAFPDATPISSALDGKGQEIRQVAELVFGPTDISRPLAAPPGVPADRLAALRKALADTMSDPRMIAMGEKMNIEWKPMSGEEVEKHLTRYYKMPREIVAKAVALTKP